MDYLNHFGDPKDHTPLHLFPMFSAFLNTSCCVHFTALCKLAFRLCIIKNITTIIYNYKGTHLANTSNNILTYQRNRVNFTSVEKYQLQQGHTVYSCVLHLAPPSVSAVAEIYWTKLSSQTHIIMQYIGYTLWPSLHSMSWHITQPLSHRLHISGLCLRQ